MLLSLFCGAGGLDLGFEQAGYEVALGFDKRPESVLSYNRNRPGQETARVRDIRDLSLDDLDSIHGARFSPFGVIGGPPCQSFSRANRRVVEDDPRHELPLVYARLLALLNRREPVHFFVLENVPGLGDDRHAERLDAFTAALRAAGFNVFLRILNASDYETPQNRERLFIVGLNSTLYPDREWLKPAPTTADPNSVTVRAALGDLPEPTYFSRGLSSDEISFHRNHWCMQPKSRKFFTPGALKPGFASNRSFKTLAWDQPSYTVAYGNREVHIHPNCHRRLSVFEAMRLQGFPDKYVLHGSLSSQILQVSEAVPPPIARAVAESVMRTLE